uniref:Si:ch211-241b2.5 n=1 Tax=Electrophorus electricus TaxID=8005 RepID=A0A4W4DWF2_ELEEL
MERLFCSCLPAALTASSSLQLCAVHVCLASYAATDCHVVTYDIHSSFRPENKEVGSSLIFLLSLPILISNLFSVSLPFTALFTVEAEQDSYYAELHSEIKMDRFRGRAQLVKEDLLKFRAVLELSQLQLNDSGMYRCIVKHQDVDYKQTKLTIWGQFSLEKNIRRTGTEEVELSCQSQGFPLAKVIWRDGRLQSLMQGSRSTNETTSEGTWNITSRVTVHTNVISNYTCSFESENRDSQEATFRIPAIAVVAVIVIVAVTSLVLHRRRKGWLSWFLVLTFTLFCVSRTAYGVLCMEVHVYHNPL